VFVLLVLVIVIYVSKPAF